MVSLCELSFPVQAGNPTQLSFRRKPESRYLILFFVFWMPPVNHTPGQAYQVRHDIIVDFNQSILGPVVL